MKRILILCLVALSIAFYTGFAEAVIQGACANCHTMHNSQNGAPMNWDGSSTPNETLLRGNCWGCHAYALINSTGRNIEFGGTTPQVAHTNATDLAGGNFAYITGHKAVDPTDSVVSANRDTAGHNVIETGNTEDISAMFPPPGDEYNQTGITSSSFTCAGIYGCHGDRTISGGSMAAIRGSHHVNDNVLKFGSINEAQQGTTTALSYRFLKGVKGGEDNDWQASSSATDHNEYKGATAGVEAGSASVPGGATISGLCAECHGNFHGEAADIGTGPWLRHPTDIVLPSSTSKEYYMYNGGTGTNNPYSLSAPVARASIPDSPSQYVNPGTDDAIVMCLSCHKAHASANADLLRWNYEDISAGTGSDTTRCFICHTTKDTGS